MNYKYYLLDNGAGQPHEVYRSRSEYQDISKAGLERAKRDGSWSGESADIRRVLDLWLQGNFDPEDDAISEDRANQLLSDWRSGVWPGRP